MEWDAERASEPASERVALPAGAGARSSHFPRPGERRDRGAGLGGHASAERTSERCRGRRAPDNARGGPVTPAGNAERPGFPHPAAAAARFCRPRHARPGGGRDRSSRPSDPAGRLRHRRLRLLLGAIKANEPRASAQRSQLNRFG
ncbi:hypothetical protein J1605_010244 [Eschrichtius robustus]|uniref:Uncharacterized protein n=1 Tax=Eschrichtius robustus TaxID=9764 RepID=A0AB34GUV4_ESCRO|nr:hypothetical protein J1605_010244 [Eschrichtius robustus]